MNGEMKGEKDEQDKRITRPGGGGDFAREIAKIAVSQVCQSTGFETSYGCALDLLADIAIRYIGELGKSSMFYASLSRRTECNVFDVIHALEDLVQFQGTPKVPSHCAVNSGAVLELKKYVISADEIPFARSLPRFPAIRDRKRIPKSPVVGEAPRSNHIPAWLPPFPDPDTYIRTPVLNDRVTDPPDDEIVLARQHRKVEEPSNGLQHEENAPDARNTKNPVSTPPKHSVKKPEAEVSTLLLQTFSPAMEAMRDRLDSGSHEGKVVPSKRPHVILEFRRSKKLLAEPVDMMIQSVAFGEGEL